MTFYCVKKAVFLRNFVENVAQFIEQFQHFLTQQKSSQQNVSYRQSILFVFTLIIFIFDFCSIWHYSIAFRCVCWVVQWLKLLRSGIVVPWREWHFWTTDCNLISQTPTSEEQRSRQHPELAEESEERYFCEEVNPTGEFVSCLHIGWKADYKRGKVIDLQSTFFYPIWEYRRAWGRIRNRS